jgi:phage tail tape-measure protein
MYQRTESYKQYNKKLYDLTMKHYVAMVASDNFETDWKLFINNFMTSGGEILIEEQNKGMMNIH